ncbi:MAG: hypothetical protein WCR71_03730 [Bacteroidales bacterium]
MVYRYKVTIPGNKIFMREYEVKASTSLYSYSIYLVNDLGFAPDQLVVFRALDKKGKVKKEYGLFDLGDGTMDSVTIEELVKQGLGTLEYVYDMFKDRALLLEVLSREELLLKKSYPRLIAEKGKNPDQFSDNYDDFEQMLDTSEVESLLDAGEHLYESEES